MKVTLPSAFPAEGRGLVLVPLSRATFLIPCRLKVGMQTDRKPVRGHSKPRPGLRPPGQSSTQQTLPGHLSPGFVPQAYSEPRLR